MKLLFSSMLTAALFFGDAALADTMPNPELDRLMLALREVQSAEGHFTERKYLQMLSEPLEDTGTLTYTAPDTLEKHTTAPEEERLSVTGNTLTVEHGPDHDTHTVDLQDYPEAQSFVESIRATLGGNLPELERLFTVDFQGTEASWRMTLRPKDPDMLKMARSVVVSGKGPALTGIVTEQGDGDRTEMTIVADRPPATAKP